MNFANSTEKQVFDSFTKAGRVLIALPQIPNGDALGAGLALHQFLKKLDKQAEIVCVAPDLTSFSFLPDVEIIKKELEVFQSFVVSLDTSKTPLDELSYETKSERVDIFLKPKRGKYSETDVSFRAAAFPYDLVVTLDTPTLESLGAVYEENTDLFFETTIVNIDHHPNNQNYGEINLVDLTATATSEILTALIQDFKDELIDETIATNLLAGIVVETNSFQHIKTTPRAFLRASNLIAKGGAHQQIIRELYKTKNISLLKLWGRALARVKEVKDFGLTYTMLNPADFQKSGSSPDDVLGVMKELVSNLSGRKIILLLAEVEEKNVTAYFYLHPSLKAQVVASALGGQMLNGYLGMFESKDMGLLEVEKQFLERLQKIRPQIES